MSLGNQADIHYARGELDEAMRLYKEVEGICRELGNNHDLAVSLANQSVLLSCKEKYNDALKSIDESNKIATDCGFMDLIPKINKIMDMLSRKKSNSGKSQTKKKPEFSPTGKLICPTCKMECEKGTPFCKWCKASLK